MSTTPTGAIVSDDDPEPLQHPRARAPAQPWSLQEDFLLRAAVAKYGEDTDSWKRIAEDVPGRTNKSCRKRWKHSLSPTLKKTAWTKEEDELLLRLHTKYPCRWSMIAKHISGRTDDACAKRYREALDPAIKQGEWTPEEDAKLLREYRRWGGRWASVAAELGRSGLGCRNRWRLLERKKSQTSSKAKRISVASKTPESDGSFHHTPEPAQDSIASRPTSDSTTWVDALLTQIQQDPFAFENSFFNLDSTESDYPMPLDPTLPGISPLGTRIQAQFDPRLLDLMEGGCGCGCGSGTGCGCTDEVSPPFMNISSQEFLDPFHVMSQVSHQFRPPPVFHPATNGHSNPLVPDANLPLDISLVPLDCLNDELVTPSAYSQANTFATLTVESSNEPSEPISNPQNSHSSVHDTSTEIETSSSPSVPEQSPSADSTSSLPRLTLRSAGPPSQLSRIPDKSKWSAQQALLALSRAKEQPKCKCSGSCCSISSDTASGCCSTRMRKRSQSPILDDNEPSDGCRKAKIQRSSPVSSTPRLSSQLPLVSQSDEQLLAYACGHSSCWASDNEIRSRFNTSGELLDHYRKAHGDLSVNSVSDGRVFRCALQGCGKGWKSINGIQYHLQLSKSHFSLALSKHILSSSPEPRPVSSSGAETAQEVTDWNKGTSDCAEQKGKASPPARRKIHSCPHPGCPNVYKQVAGLKYHLAHGHPDKPPLQLGRVPPALVYKLHQKAQRA